MERRFVISYLYEGQRLGPVGYGGAISEAEVMKRLKCIQAYVGPFEDTIDILLHGWRGEDIMEVNWEQDQKHWKHRARRGESHSTAQARGGKSY